jgi:hypothetical protein
VRHVDAGVLEQIAEIVNLRAEQRRLEIDDAAALQDLLARNVNQVLDLIVCVKETGFGFVQ